MPSEVTLTNEQKITGTIAPITLTGKPSKIDGSVQVSVISGAGTFQVVDSTHFALISPDDPGDTTYLVEGDADLGEGIEEIQDTVVLHTLGARAANLGLTFGAPEPK